MKIGQLAQKAGCQVVTIRYYEKEGLLDQPERTGSNYRIYSEDDLERLRFIRHCRLHGMTLSEIRELLAFKAHPAKNCDWIDSMVEKHIRNVDEQIAALQHLRSHLEELRHKCEGGRGEQCGILRSLNEEEECPYCSQFTCQLLPANRTHKD
ncbi:MAG: Cd(II)/Pb(II)-responsive transcriptional regulator [Desulfovibrionaceae bacterium]|nr:Cd(II)/Pb(II)-responsive transcriptional regulator [Desulfovibrionaceae bacterium]